ncbi:hypothetical protein [Methylobacterium durans]|uniref:Uncharacterized protein n=1 Tax=Methylobacterium durans TaxID=2202825 RepID=A0A2U8WBN1_9HYPH|nr:hypothetical protein [Methylobacterium durans]AWN43565.1 hypothetical protein DK389_27495 [Methylobacterium durans]
MAIVRALAPSALLLCMLLAAAAMFVDGPLLAAAGGGSTSSSTCQSTIPSVDAGSASWIDPPLRLSPDRRRRQADAIGDEVAED